MCWRHPAFWLALLIAASLSPAAAQPASGDREISAELETWIRQIEETAGGTVVIVRVQHDLDSGLVRLPQELEFREVLARYLRSPAFLSTMVESHALNLNYKGPEGLIHFVLLNMGRAEEWGPYEEAVLAHELGHIWLSVLGYPAPFYDGGANSCVAMVAGDVVQHIVIRRELDRRGIPHVAYWISKLEASQEALEAGIETPLTPCRVLMQLGEWLDVRLGLSPVTWEGYDRYLATMEESFPMLTEEVEVLCGVLSDQDAEEIGVHESLLRIVLDRVNRLAIGLGQDAPAGVGPFP